MTDKLARVRKALTSRSTAYQEAVAEEAAALEALAAARKRREAAGETVKTRRAALHQAIIEAAALDMRQVDIVNLSGYTRDRVYNIVKDATKPAGE